MSVVMAILAKLKQYVDHRDSLLPLGREGPALGGREWLSGSGRYLVGFVFLATVE